MGNSLRAVFENKGTQLPFLRWLADQLLLEACDQLCYSFHTASNLLVQDCFFLKDWVKVHNILDWLCYSIPDLLKLKSQLHNIGSIAGKAV